MTSIVLGVLLFTALVMLLSAVVLRARAWLMPTTVVSLTINKQPAVDIATGGKLLDALVDINIPVPSACAGAGTCGLCKVVVLEGGGALLPTEAARLTDEDRKTQQRLSCQLVVRNDMRLAIPSHILEAEQWQVSVESVRNLSPLIREITLAMPAGKRLDFKPGEYVQISSRPYNLDYSSIVIDEQCREAWQRLGVNMLQASSNEVVTRAYSLANLPDDNDHVVLLIRLALPPPAQLRSLPPGIVSSWLFSVEVGDMVDVSGPYGEFGLRDNEREMVLIGGGVGMAPLRSIIHHELCTGETRPVSFYYGARSQGDLFYRQEFTRLQSRHKRFHWVTALSDPDANTDWDGPTGFIHDVFKTDFLDDHKHPERCDYYLCGPPLMQKAVMSVLDDAGVDASHVFADVFGD